MVCCGMKANNTQCKISGRVLTRKQRILTNLNAKHKKSPLKRVYELYADDSSVPIPKRTASRFAVRARLFSPNSHQSSSECLSGPSDEDLSDSNVADISGEEFSTCSNANAATHTISEIEVVSPSHLRDSEDDTTSVEDDCDSDSSSSESESSSLSSMDTFIESSDCGESDSYSMEQSETYQLPHQPQRTIAETEVQALCLLSYILRLNESGVAVKDLLQLLCTLCPSENELEGLTYDKVMFMSGDKSFKTVHYCCICSNRFPENPDIFLCEINRCGGYRYKGNLLCQQKPERQPNNFFIIADIQKQLKYLHCYEL